MSARPCSGRVPQQLGRADGLLSRDVEQAEREGRAQDAADTAGWQAHLFEAEHRGEQRRVQHVPGGGPRGPFREGPNAEYGSEAGPAFLLDGTHRRTAGAAFGASRSTTTSSSRCHLMSSNSSPPPPVPAAGVLDQPERPRNVPGGRQTMARTASPALWRRLLPESLARLRPPGSTRTLRPPARPQGSCFVCTPCRRPARPPAAGTGRRRRSPRPASPQPRHRGRIWCLGSLRASQLLHGKQILAHRVGNCPEAVDVAGGRIAPMPPQCRCSPISRDTIHGLSSPAQPPSLPLRCWFPSNRVRPCRAEGTRTPSSGAGRITDLVDDGLVHRDGPFTLALGGTITMTTGPGSQQCRGCAHGAGSPVPCT